MMGPWGLGMGVGSLVFVALIVIGIVLVVRPPSRVEGGRETTTRRRILDERFARGEIDEDEYERRRRTFEATSASGALTAPEPGRYEFLLRAGSPGGGMTGTFVVP